MIYLRWHLLKLRTQHEIFRIGFFRYLEKLVLDVTISNGNNE